MHQSSIPSRDPTHSRRLTLPMSGEFSLSDGRTYSCQYLGHGQIKVVFKVACMPNGDPLPAHLGPGPLVLKLTPDKDPEPDTCKELVQRIKKNALDVKICPHIYATGVVEEQDSLGNVKQVWYAWFAELAYPLDQYMVLPEADCKACLKIALYKQVVVAQHGLLLSDNNPFNFGVVPDTGSYLDTVVIIDMGSNLPEAHPVQKSTLNHKAMKGWWKKLEWVLPVFSDAEECRSTWTNPENYDLDLVAQKVCNTVLLPISSTAAESASAGSPITAAPASWDLLANAAADREFQSAQYSVQWLLDTFVFDTVAGLKLLPNGQAIPVRPEERQSPILRLENLIILTKSKRAPFIKHPDDILSFHMVDYILEQWQRDWPLWMLDDEVIHKWYTTPWDDRQAFENSRFRTFIFQMCGCRNLLKFWLHVPASYATLASFHWFFDARWTSSESSSSAGRYSSGQKRRPSKAETTRKFLADREAMGNAIHYVRRQQQSRQ